MRECAIETARSNTVGGSEDIDARCLCKPIIQNMKGVYGSPGAMTSFTSPQSHLATLYCGNLQLSLNTDHGGQGVGGIADTSCSIVCWSMLISDTDFRTSVVMDRTWKSKRIMMKICNVARKRDVFISPYLKLDSDIDGVQSLTVSIHWVVISY